MRVEVDQAKCQGHSKCVLLAPDVFDVDEHGRVVVLAHDIPPDSQDDAREAAYSCPERVISVAED